MLRLNSSSNGTKPLNFQTFLQTPCSQPQPHLDKPWFSASADTEQAEKLLNAVPMDGAFMVRYSSTDKTVFVVNLDKELRVEAIEPFDGIVDDCQMLKSDQLKAFPPLSFPIGTQITVLSMDQNDHNIVGDEQQHIWVGRYNEKTGWFPAKCVRKLTATNGGTTDGNNMLNYGTIELSGTTFKQDIHYLGSELIQSGAILLRLTQASAAISPFGTLKKVLAICTGLQVSSLRLLLDGRRVNDDDTSQSLEMCVGDVIEVYKEQVGGAPTLINLNVQFGPDLREFIFDMDDSIAVVKSKIHDQMPWTPVPAQMSLYFSRRLLADSKRLRDINISKDQMLDVRKAVGAPVTN